MAEMSKAEILSSLAMFIVNHGNLGDDERYWHGRAHSALEALTSLWDKEPFFALEKLNG